MKKVISFSAVLAFAPFLAFAEARSNNIYYQLSGLLNYIIPVLIAIPLIYFIWGVIQYFLSQKKDTKNARKKIIKSLIILFIVLSFWQISNVVITWLMTRGNPLPPCVEHISSVGYC